MKKFFSRIKALWIRFFSKSETALTIAVKVTQAIKNAIDSGKIESLQVLATKYLPTVAAVVVDKIVSAISKYIPVITADLGLLQESIFETDKEKKASLILTLLIGHVPEAKREALYSTLAEKVALDLSDGEWSPEEIGEEIKLIYNKLYKNATT